MTDNPQPKEPVLPGEPENLTDAELDKEAQITPADKAAAYAKAKRVKPLWGLMNAKTTDKGTE